MQPDAAAIGGTPAFVEIKDGGEDAPIVVRVVNVVRVAGRARVVARHHWRSAAAELPA